MDWYEFLAKLQIIFTNRWFIGITCTIILVTVISLIVKASSPDKKDEQKTLTGDSIINTQGGVIKPSEPPDNPPQPSNTNGGDSWSTMHNEFRKHKANSVDNLVNFIYDTGLERQAQEYANNLAANQKFEHSHFPGQGENLHLTMNSSRYPDDTPCDVIYSWYNGPKEYECDNYVKTKSISSSTGHYTQVMWNYPDSIQPNVGCAQATGKYDGMKALWTVCRYSPPGNYSGSSERPNVENTNTSQCNYTCE